MSRIDTINRIVENHQFEKVDGLELDVQTASLLKQVHAGLGEENRGSFETMPLTKLVSFAWSVVK